MNVAGIPIHQAFDYSTVAPAAAADLHARVVAIRIAMGDAVDEVGKQLIAAKALLNHGEFQDWAEAELGMGVRTAENYMNAARFVVGKTKCVSLLSLTALYTLAAPATPPKVVAEVLAEVERGIAPKAQDIRDRIAGVTKAQKAAASAKALDEDKRKRDSARHSRATAAEQKRSFNEEQAAREGRRKARTEEVAAFLVEKLGAEGVHTLRQLMRGTDWHNVEQHLNDSSGRLA